jgi:nitroreductase
MKEFIDLVKRRRSIRRYRPDEIPRTMIESCMEAVRYAPTASNIQGWRFFVVEGDLKEELLKRALGGIVVPNKWASTAPAVVALAMKLSVVTDRIGAAVKDIDYHVLDAGIAGEHFILRATELGLGTCWIGWFNKKAVRELLNIPSGWDVPALITVGFPAEIPEPKDRRPVSEICVFKGSG